MKTLLLLPLAILVAGCTKLVEHTEQTSMATAERASTQFELAALDIQGLNTISQVDAWFRDTRRNCGSNQRPAFLCGGVMMRVSESYKSFDPWMPSPPSVKRTGVSFSWMRQDTKIYNTFNFRNGFIFYPVMARPASKAQIQVLCVFPRDGATDRRNPACGSYPGYAQVSRPCDQQGITTAGQWLTHYRSLPITGAVCGWSVVVFSPTSADRFYQSILARQSLGGGDAWNEVILEPWPNVNPATLPIAAFFYQSGNADARNRANDDQRRYNQKYGQMIPVIALSYSTASGLTAQYHPQEQGLRQSM